MAKEDGFVMATNNSSIVSKRSVERLYYAEPHFIRYFVKKPIKRSPLINRGYWLRMWAILNTIKDFLQRPATKKYVLNLGCGADPTPFQFLAKHPELCSDVVFVDVDHAELMRAKTDIIHRTPQLRHLLSNVLGDAATTPLLLQSDQYVAIGCDLRNLPELERAVKAIITAGASVLCVAEVSITYMELQKSDSLIAWAAGLSDDVTFCLLEQCLPDGPNHPFAKTMLTHFEKLRSPLRSVQTYQTTESQRQRFLDRGWRNASATSLWDVWSTQARHSPGLERDTEPFDEWEEFALFASHYFILIASNNRRVLLPSFFAPSIANERSHTDLPLVETANVGSTDYISNPKSKGSRHHAALIVAKGECVGIHGGMGLHRRLSNISLYSKDRPTPASIPMPPAAPRLCHSITALPNSTSLLVGGRASPTTALSDCWILDGDSCKSIANLPSPRYRHCASSVTFEKASGILIFGGKSSDARAHSEWLLWEPEQSWRILAAADEGPCARFGASIVSLGPSDGVLFGGMDHTGLILDDIWHWSLVLTDEQVRAIRLRQISGQVLGASMERLYMARFGASVHTQAGRLVVVGGVGRTGCISSDKEIFSIPLDSLFETKQLALRPAMLDLCRSYILSPQIPRPLFIGHSSLLADDNELIIVGGGAVCFSFGTFWNEGSWTIHLETADKTGSPWKFIDIVDAAAGAYESNPAKDTNLEAIPMKQVEVKLCQAPELEFGALLQDKQPTIIKGLELGLCTDLWTSNHLIESVGAERAVVVHKAATSVMNFQKKNFEYITLPFEKFIRCITSGEKMYLRSLSSERASERPSDFWEDFPGLAKDFSIPAQLHAVAKTVHSSVLRISNSVMWLHYDTYANILCQIRGSRKLVLYPPGDVIHLSVPPGTSTSQLDVFENESTTPRAFAGTHPQEVTLNAGDVLFIPPLWLHAGAPTDEVSVAVNVFFRSFEKGYAAGRDVYGNRDLKAYENGRRNLDNIMRGFEDVPSDIAHAYLGRLLQEMKERTRNLVG